MTQWLLYPVHRNKLSLGCVVPVHITPTPARRSLYCRVVILPIRDLIPIKLSDREGQTEHVVGDPESTVGLGHQVECLVEVLGSFLAVGLTISYVSLSL